MDEPSITGVELMTSTTRLEEWEKERYSHSIPAYVERLKKTDLHEKHKVWFKILLALMLILGTNIFS